MRYAEAALGISLRELLALGRQNPADADEPFNMAYLAMRGSGAVNGVSRLHGQVSRHIFAPLFPRWPQAEVPVGYVTNGVHMPTWDSAAADAALDGCLRQMPVARDIDDHRGGSSRGIRRAAVGDAYREP